MRRVSNTGNVNAPGPSRMCKNHMGSQAVQVCLELGASCAYRCNTTAHALAEHTCMPSAFVYDCQVHAPMHVHACSERRVDLPTRSQAA